MRNQHFSPENLKLLLDDYFNWDAQIAKIESDELTAVQKKRIANSFEYLRTVLGEEFPKECFENGNPINHYFANRAPWTRVWLSWLAEAMREMSFSTSIGSIIIKLKSHKHEDYYEAITLLEVGCKVVKAGLTIELERKLLNDKGESKKPDLTVVDPGTSEQCIIEVTRLTKNTNHVRYESLMQRVHFEGINSRVQIQFAGRLLKDLSNEHFQEIESEISLKVKRCIDSNAFQEIDREGVLEFAAAPEGNPLFAEWALAKQIDTNSFSFPEGDVLARVRGKITHKKDQLSSAYPCILVIRNEEHWISSGNYESIQEGLLESIHKCPQLMALVLIGGEMSSIDKKVSTKGFNFYVERTERHLHTSKTIILFNRYCKTKISPHTWMRIFDAFEKH
jgi:hypothetical protein